MDLLAAKILVGTLLAVGMLSGFVRSENHRQGERIALLVSSSSLHRLPSSSTSSIARICRVVKGKKERISTSYKVFSKPLILLLNRE